MELEKDRDEHLREWVKQTNDVNRQLRAKGIEPRYTCSFRNGIFKESRKD